MPTTRKRTSLGGDKWCSCSEAHRETDRGESWGWFVKCDDGGGGGGTANDDSFSDYSDCSDCSGENKDKDTDGEFEDAQEYDKRCGGSFSNNAVKWSTEACDQRLHAQHEGDDQEYGSRVPAENKDSVQRPWTQTIVDVCCSVGMLVEGRVDMGELGVRMGIDMLDFDEDTYLQITC
jgi:hypothetical protein